MAYEVAGVMFLALLAGALLIGTGYFLRTISLTKLKGKNDDETKY